MRTDSSNATSPIVDGRVSANTSRHVLVINRWNDDFARYHQAIDHHRHRVSYITTRPGFDALVPELAEEVVVIDQLENPTAAQHALRLIARHGAFDHIIALSEFDLELAAQLREALGVPGSRPADVKRVRDKVAMKQHVARGGVRVPRFIPTSSPDEVMAFARVIGLPLILKPRDGAASHGVIEVRTWSELEAALASIALERYECEEFITGDVYQLDGLIAAGRLQAMRPARCLNTDLQFARGERVGSVLNDDPELEERFREFALRVLRALELDNSAFHLEVFRTRPTSDAEPDELVFLEIGARVGGAQITYMWRDLYDVDLNDAWIRLQLGEPLRLPQLDASSPVGGFLLVPEPPDVPCQVESATSLIGTIAGLYAEFLPPVGTILDGRGGYDDIAGRFRFTGGSSAEVEAAIRIAMDEYRFETRSITPDASAPSPA
jgi:biotin carboxylase